MIGLSDISELVDYAIASAAVAEERNPASLLLIGIPESGKSDLLTEAAAGNPYCHILTDLTAWGLAQYVVLPMSKRPPDQVRARVLVIPDFVTVLSRSSATVASLCTTLAAYIEEGVHEIQTGAVHLPLKRPITGSVITCCTPGVFMDRRRSWIKTGFAQRLLTVSYSYAPEVALDIHRAIQTRGASGAVRERFKLPCPPRPIATNPEGFRWFQPAIKDYLEAFRLEQDAYGFRVRKAMQRLALGSAVMHGRASVEEEDVWRVKELVERYGNLEMRQAT